MIRRVGRPGLIGLAARTAVVAGTANAMNRHAMNRSEELQQRAATEDAERQMVAQQRYAAQQQQYAAQQQQYAPQQPAQPAAQGPTAAGKPDITGEITKLADLKTQGLLTDEEFAAAKAKLLAG